MYINDHYQPEIKLLSCDMVRHSPRHPTWNCDNLAAPVWRLYWMPKPHARLILDEIDITPGPDLVILIPPNTPLKTRCNEPLFQFVVHFLAAAPYDLVKPTLFQIPASPDWRELIDRIVSRLDSTGVNCDRELTMLNLSMCLRALVTIPAEFIETRPDDRKIAAVIKTIDEHLAHKFSVIELSRDAGLSVNMFIRRFKTHVGMTPQQYIIKKRVDRAGVMLAHSEMTIDEIAEATGFCNRNHFTQAFLKLRLLGPAAYRKHMARERH